MADTDRANSLREVIAEPFPSTIALRRKGDRRRSIKREETQSNKGTLTHHEDAIHLASDLDTQIDGIWSRDRRSQTNSCDVLAVLAAAIHLPHLKIKCKRFADPLRGDA